MTIEARTTFLGITIKRRTLERDATLSFKGKYRTGNGHVDPQSEVDVQILIVSPDELGIKSHFGFLDDKLGKNLGWTVTGNLNLRMLDKDQINRASEKLDISQGFPGLKTKLIWSSDNLPVG